MRRGCSLFETIFRRLALLPSPSGLPGKYEVASWEKIAHDLVLMSWPTLSLKFGRDTDIYLHFPFINLKASNLFNL